MTETATVIEEERYARQMLLWGREGQKKLAAARVAVIGLGPQGVYTALCMASLGVGNIVLIDGSDAEDSELFLDMPLVKGSRALGYVGLLQRINKQVSIEAYPCGLESKVEQALLDETTVIVDTTNSIVSKRHAIEFGREKRIPVLSTSSRRGYTQLRYCDLEKKDPADLMPQFENAPQDPLMGLALCGIITEEVRKLIFGESNDFLKQPVRYRLGKGYRYGIPHEEAPIPNSDIYKNLSVVFLGGGALGCWGAIAASQMGFGRVDIVDYDTFESHNINRQVLAYDGIGKLKAEHIAEKIRRMSRGQTHSDGYNTLILPGFELSRHYDLAFDFVDNRYTRAINSAWVITHGVPLISAGALPSSARWDVHQDGKTQCMNHLFNIYEEGRNEEMIRRASCAANPNPSVVMSNAIAAVHALLNAYTIFEPDRFGEPFNGQQVYRADSPKRLGTSPLDGVCDCYKKPVPDLTVTNEQVHAFVEANPQALRTVGGQHG